MKRCGMVFVFILCAVSVMGTLDILAQDQEEPAQDIQQPTQAIDEAKAVLDSLIAPFRARDIERFMDCATREYMPGYDTLRSQASEAMRDFDDIDISYIVIAERVQGEYVILTIRWEKLWKSLLSGSTQKTEGTTTLTFVRTLDGYKMLDAVGDRLF